MMSRPNLLKSQLAAAAAGTAPDPTPTSASTEQRTEQAPAEPRGQRRATRAKPPAGQGAAPAKARVGKTMLAGYYSTEFARAVRILAAEQDVTVQSLIGEGLDLVLRKNGKHPFGER